MAVHAEACVLCIANACSCVQGSADQIRRWISNSAKILIIQKGYVACWRVCVRSSWVQPGYVAPRRVCVRSGGKKRSSPKGRVDDSPSGGLGFVLSVAEVYFLTS